MDEIIMYGIFFLIFLAVGINSCFLQRNINKNSKILEEYEISDKEAKKTPILAAFIYIKNYNITSISLYFASSMIFLIFLLRI